MARGLLTFALSRNNQQRDAAMPHQTDIQSPVVHETSSKIEEILWRVQGEFLEMPGLRLTEAQARAALGPRCRDVRGVARRPHRASSCFARATARSCESSMPHSSRPSSPLARRV